MFHKALALRVKHELFIGWRGDFKPGHGLTFYWLAQGEVGAEKEQGEEKWRKSCKIQKNNVILQREIIRKGKLCADII